MSWSIVYTAAALQNKQQLTEQGFQTELEQTLHDVMANPNEGIELVGDLAGAYSKTIIAQHCVVYQILPEQHVVKVICIV